MIPLDAQTLRDIAPRFSGAQQTEQRRLTDAIGPLLTAKLDRYAINTRLRIVNFLGQTCEESAGFRTLEEFASGDAYEGRKDLGNTQQGDGRRFKGRGLIQITGRDNYARIGEMIGLDLVNQPELAASPPNALVIACEYWKAHDLNVAADRDDLLSITRSINGGTNGVADRRTYTAAAKAVIARTEALMLHGVQGNTPGTDRPVLHRGSQGPYVEQLQNKLLDHGYKLAIDGEFGPATEKVVETFQTAAFPGQPEQIDGIVGCETWAMLDT